jgi:folate-dependent phosphoribosylglycinamide formyltransferase PurN
MAVREPFRWAFLVLEDHPYGREMLREILAGGFVPDLVIEERSAVAEVERTKFVTRLRGFPLAPPFDELLAGRAMRREVVPHHDDPRCVALLRDLAPELIVLGGTRILSSEVFERGSRGTLNAHPGLLPEVRGSASVAWAIALDERVGCTCHFIEAGIDTGPVVSRREIPVHRGDTYEKLCHATVAVSALLMREALEALRDGTLRSTPQGAGAPAHKNMPDEGVDAVRRKLAEGRYAHFVD